MFFVVVEGGLRKYEKSLGQSHVNLSSKHSYSGLSMKYRRSLVSSCLQKEEESSASVNFKMKTEQHISLAALFSL